MEKMENKPRGRLTGVAFLASSGIALVLTTLMGLGVGLYLDGKLGTGPWLMVAFLIIGVAAGFRNIFYLIKKYGI